MIEPLAVAMHSMQFAAVQIGERVAVWGAGPIGLLTLGCLKAAGAGRIWVVEPLAHRREMALAMGADAVIDPAAVDAAQEIYRDAGNRGADCAIDCAAKEHTTNEAIRAVCNGGRVVLTGIHSACFVPFEVSPMRRKEVAIFNVRRSNDEPERARDLLAARLEYFAPMVTHHRPLREIAPAFGDAEHYAAGAIKTIIVP
ncbi:MAG: zinc-binding dehydrogenase, partial [Acidobacteriota bacterium]|nr:zinc-binding dehydrogenase [Acidobacteriota bacterium]